MTARYTDGEDADPAAAARRAGGARWARAGGGPRAGDPDRSRECGPWCSELAARSTLPMVIDADALNALGTEAPKILAAAPAPRVLTPHPGEMGRLLGHLHRRGAVRSARPRARAGRGDAGRRRPQGGAHDRRGTRRSGVRQSVRLPARSPRRAAATCSPGSSARCWPAGGCVDGRAGCRLPARRGGRGAGASSSATAWWPVICRWRSRASWSGWRGPRAEPVGVPGGCHGG